MKSESSTYVSFQAPDSWDESYERIRPEIFGLDERDLLPVNLDVIAASTKAIGVLPKVLRYRDELAKVGTFDIRLLDKLEDYAQAAACAHLRHTSSALPPDEFREIVERVATLRANFLVDVTALIRRKLVPSEVVRGLRGGVGYKNLVADLFVLGDVLRRYWPSIEGKCATTLAELEEARHLVATMQKVIAKRESASASIEETAEIRDRAFSLFINAYAEIRRAVIFIRGKRRDADKIVPSLYSGRKVGKRNEDAVEESDVEVAASIAEAASAEPEATATRPGGPVAA